jgi:hypothetical protein
MQYLLLHAAVPDAPVALPDFDSAPTKWIEEMEGREVIRGSYRLRPAGNATTVTVRVRDGETLLTHGPYAELQEQVAGYDLIEATDLDEAIEIASKHPSASLGAVEVRPLWQE